MSTPCDQLIQSITDTGVAESEAQQHAARRCALATARGGASGYVGGGALSCFLAMNPASAVPYAVVGLGVDAAYALVKSPQCSQVREAIRFWNTAPLGTAPSDFCLNGMSLAPA